MIQQKVEEQVAFMEERIEECQAKLISLEGVTTAGAEAGAAPMMTEPEPSVSSGVTPAAYPLGDEIGAAAENIMAGSRYSLQVRQQMIGSIVAGAGATGPGGMRDPLALLERSQEVIEAVLQDVGIYSAVTHSQSVWAL